MDMKSENIVLLASDILIDDNKIWFCCDDFNGLACSDMEGNVLEIVDNFPEISLYRKLAIGCMVKVDDMLVFAPGTAGAIYTYQLTDRVINTYMLPDDLEIDENAFKFIHAYVYEKSVFVISYARLCIVRFDVFDGRITCYNQWEKKFLNCGYKNKFILIENELCLVGEKIFVPPRNGDCIIEIDMKCQEVQFHDLKCREDMYCTLCFDGDFFWTCGFYNHTIVQINKNYEVVNEISLEEMCQEIEYKEFAFKFSYKKENFIWLFSYNYDKYIKVDVINRILNIYSFSNNPNYFLHIYRNMKKEGSEIYLFEMREKNIYICNDDLEVLNKIQFTIKREVLYKYLHEREGKESIVEERALYNDLHRLLWCLKQES